jgi:hypothetical protein
LHVSRELRAACWAFVADSHSAAVVRRFGMGVRGREPSRSE